MQSHGHGVTRLHVVRAAKSRSRPRGAYPRSRDWSGPTRAGVGRPPGRPGVPAVDEGRVRRSSRPRRFSATSRSGPGLGLPGTVRRSRRRASRGGPLQATTGLVETLDASPAVAEGTAATGATLRWLRRARRGHVAPPARVLKSLDAGGHRPLGGQVGARRSATKSAMASASTPQMRGSGGRRPARLLNDHRSSREPGGSPARPRRFNGSMASAIPGRALARAESVTDKVGSAGAECAGCPEAPPPERRRSMRRGTRGIGLCSGRTGPQGKPLLEFLELLLGRPAPGHAITMTWTSPRACRSMRPRTGSRPHPSG